MNTLKKFSIMVALHINGLFPFLYPARHIFKNGHFFTGIWAFFSDYFTYKNLNRTAKSPFPAHFLDTYPMYFDRYDEAGEIPKHYFLQDLWAAKKVFVSKTKVHYDIGSRIDSFISHCLVFCKVVMLDVRPLKSAIPNLEFIQADCRDMSHIKSNSVQSLSTLHAFEHFGLGRYGDPIDPLGYAKAIKEVVRIMKKGGDIYFGTPIGKQRLAFNAHRVFDPQYIVELFDGCALEEFSVIDDNDVFHENTNLAKYRQARYSCGLFHFKKK